MDTHGTTPSSDLVERARRAKKAFKDLALVGELGDAVRRQLWSATRDADPNFLDHLAHRAGGELKELLREAFLPMEIRKLMNGLTDSDVRKYVQDRLKSGFVFESNPRALVTPEQFEVVDFLKDCDGAMTGEDMCRIALELDANLGLHEADILLGQQDRFPAEWSPYRFLFPATVMTEQKTGIRYMPGIFIPRFGEGWKLDFEIMVDAGFFTEPYRLLRFTPYVGSAVKEGR